MAQPLDPNMFEEVSAQPAEQAAPAAPASIAAMPAEQQQPAVAPPKRPLDRSMFESLPDYANGMSDATPVTKSPLNFEERLKLSVGNESGKMNFLKQRFEAVKKNEEGEIVVKDKGLWHAIDGSTFGDADALTRAKGILRAYMSSVGALASFSPMGMGPDSLKNAKAAIKWGEEDPVAKEILGNAADVAPTAAAITANAGIATMTGGLSIPAQFALNGGGAALMRGSMTSWGRFEGTYDAPIEQQITDVALEGLLNAGGVFIRPAAKFGKEHMPEAITAWAKNFRQLPAFARDSFKQVYGRFSAGVDAIDETLENPGVVKELFNIGKQAGSDKSFMSVMAEQKVEAARKLNSLGRNALKAVYSKAEDDLIKAVPANFVGDVSEVATGSLTKLLNRGLVTLKVGDDLLPVQDAIEMMASGKSVLKNAEWVVNSADDLARAYKNGGIDLADAALVEELGKSLHQVVGKLNIVSGAKALKGKDGVKMMLKTADVLEDLTYQLKQQGKEQSVNSIERMMTEIHEGLKGGFTAQFEKYGAKNAFESISREYASVKRPLTDLANAVSRAEKAGNDAPIEALLKKMASRAGLNETGKNAFNSIPTILKQKGFNNISRDFAATQTWIRAADAASAFLPRVAEGALSRGALTTAVGYSAATMNPLGMVGVGVGLAATSPRLAMHSTLMYKGLMESKSQLAKLGTDGIKQMASNPALMGAFTKSVLSLPAVSDGIQENILQPVGQMMGGGQ